MKNLTERINEAKQKLEIQDDSINFIDKKDLEKFAREEYLMKAPDEDVYVIKVEN